MNKLTVVIVHYNTKDFLAACLESLFRETAGPFQAVVVDNASRDQDFDSLRKAFPQVRFLLNRRNVGFAAACNQVLRQFPSSYYLLLNPDCIVLEGAVDRSVEFLERHPQAGILGCRVENPDGTLQLACRRSIPSPSVAFYRFSGLSLLFPHSRRFGRYNLTYLPEHQTAEVEAVSGSFLLFRQEVLHDIGLLDEGFFLYGEDLDFCYRALQAGWKVYYYAGARVLHHKRRSSLHDARTTESHFYRAMWLFYQKHFGQDAWRLERILVYLGIRLLHLSHKLRRRLGKKVVGSGI